MRKLYYIDRQISKIGDFICPQACEPLRGYAFQFISPLMGMAALPWCLWPNDKINYNIVKVDPFNIRYEIKDGLVPFKDNTRYWKRAKVFKSHQAVIDIFLNNIPYTETIQYKSMISKVDKGTDAYWCKSREDVEKYFLELIETYKDMKTNGYRRTEARVGSVTKWDGVYPNEILVSIDNKNQMYLEKGGTHRLSIARLLKLREVYVAIIREFV